MTAVSGRIPVFVGGLALAAAVIFAPDAAQARDECNALDASGAATCADAAYAGGIRYDANDGWPGGVAGPVTLTVTGGSATTISAPASPPNVWTDGAIVVRTAVQGSGDSTSRAIALTVGSGGNAVTIAEDATETNHGIVVHQFGKAADAATVTIGSGVAIGTMTAPMKHYGVQVLVTESTNTADHTITSAATIHSTGFGLLMDARGSGDTAVTNSGSITTAETGGTAGQQSGIRVLDWTGGFGDDRTADTATTVTNSGSIAVNAAQAHGIHVDADGLGLYRTVHSGTVSASGAGGHGIYVQASRHAGAAGSEAVAVESSGAVTATGAGGHGILVDGSSAPDPGDGNIAVTTTGGTITATGAGALGILVGNAADGDITVTNAAAIEAAADGIHVGKNPANKGAIRIVNTAAIEAKRYGIVVWHGGRSDVRIENGGAIAPASGASPARIGILVDQAAAGDVAIVNGADVTGNEQGIFARNTEGGGAVTVTHSAGEVHGRTGSGILAGIGRWRDEDGADSPAPNSTATVRVEVTGGSVKASETHGRVAVEAFNNEGGSAEVSISQGATVTARHNAGIYAILADRQNTGGRIGITQGGTIAAEKGIYAVVSRASAADETRAAAAQPLIDVAWTGTFTQAERAASSWNNVAHAIEGAQEGQAGAAIRGARYTAGIDAEIMSWRVLNRIATTGDDPGEIADAAAQMNLLSETHADSRRAAILTRFRTVLTATAATIPGADAIDGDDDGSYSDAELVAYLSEDAAARRTLLRDVLARDLSAAEQAVLEAVATGGDVDAVDAALDDASFSDAYKTAVKALLANHNVGNIRVAMNAGSIDSRGDGIRAWFARQHDGNGSIAVTVAEGATVTGGAAGVYVSGAGTGLSVEKKYTSKEVQDAEANRELDADALVSFPDYLDQVVRVQGTVTGGTDAAVHLDGGGALIVTGAGKLVAGSSGRAVLVNDPGPAVIYIDGAVTGAAGPEDDRAPAAVHLTGGGSVTIGLEGSVRAGGAMSAIRGDAPTAVIVHTESTVDTLTPEQARTDLARIEGGSQKLFSGEGITEVTFAEIKGGVPTGFTRDGLLPVDPVDAKIGENERVDVEFGELRFSCNAQDGRCRLYEALPSILLAMNGLPTRAERASAARDGSGGWARIEGGGGKWTAERSASPGPKLSFDHSRYGVRAGADAAVGENGRLGASVHGFRGDAKVPSSGTAKLSGVGVGVHATAMLGGFHVDAQAAATWYDVDLKSSTRPMTPLLKADVKGRGHAVGIEVGRRTPVTDEVSVTPRAGVVWSEVSLKDFTDEDEIGSGAEVSVEEGESLTGRAGVSVESEASEGVRLFGTLDVTHEFSEETEVAVSGTPLRASAETTGVRFGVGGTFDLGHGASLQGTAGYALTGGSGNRAYGGGLNLIVSF